MKDTSHPVPGEPKWRHRRFLQIAFVYLLSLLSPAISAADVGASIDRSSVSLSETVQLTLQSDGKPGSRPDLSVLAPDFEILDRRTSHNVSFINGRRSERHVLTLWLRPRRIGDLRIPSIRFGDAATEPLQLSVAPSPAGSPEPAVTYPPPTASDERAPAPRVMLEADLKPPQGYVGQRLLLTVKVLMDSPLQGFRLHDPQIPDARVLPLGENRSQAERNGQSFRVYERRYAIFPGETGPLKIDPLLFEGWWSSGRPMAGGGYASPGQHIAVRSEALTAEILAVPEGTGKDNWPPARDLVTSSAPTDIPRRQSPELAAPGQTRRGPYARTEPATQAPPTLQENRQDKGQTRNHLWIWIAAGLALAWIATMAGWWRSKHRATPVAPAPVLPDLEPPPAIEETDPLERAIEAVRAAYQAGDAGAAREALLAWAGQVVPEQAPSNLARLAQRCPQPLRDQILLLEQAFFSPQPVDWDKQPVWEGLRGLVPAPPEEPASFRRGKRIRRRAANPDAE